MNSPFQFGKILPSPPLLKTSAQSCSTSNETHSGVHSTPLTLLPFSPDRISLPSESICSIVAYHFRAAGFEKKPPPDQGLRNALHFPSPRFPPGCDRRSVRRSSALKSAF